MVVLSLPPRAGVALKEKPNPNRTTVLVGVCLGLVNSGQSDLSFSRSAASRSEVWLLHMRDWDRPTN